jgi:hypothetical protein
VTNSLGLFRLVDGAKARRVGVGPHVPETGLLLPGGCAVSIVRIGLAETKKFAEGYAAIFGDKSKKDESETTAEKKKEGKKPEKPGKKQNKK